MKTKLFFLIASTICFLLACNQSKPSIETPVNDSSTPEEIIRADERINDFVFQADQYTISDLIEYLEVDLKNEKHKSEALKSNICNQGLGFLHTVYNVNQEGSDMELLKTYRLYQGLTWITSPPDLYSLLIEMKSRGILTEVDFKNDAKIFSEVILKNKRSEYQKSIEDLFEFISINS